MKAQQKKLSGCASNSLAHEDLGHFGEANHWNIQAKFYNEKFPLVYESDNIRDSLSWRSWCYFEAQVWQKDSSIVPSLFFSHFFVWAFSLFLWPLFLVRTLKSHPDLWGNHSLHHPFLTWDNALIMKIITLLFSYNSRITTRYLEQYMNLCECLWRCTRMCNESRMTCIKNMMNGGFATNTMSTTWSCKQYDNDEACHNNGTMESCMQYISEWLWKCHNR